MKSVFMSCESLSLNLNGVSILKDINLALERGEFHLLMGENGAGKTSILNILSGVYPTGGYIGTICLEGEELHLHSTKDALEHGIFTLHQDTYLFENLTIAENLYSNTPGIFQEKKFWSLSSKIKRANDFFRSYGLEIDSSKKVSSLNLAQRRIIELAKLYLTQPKLLILDEPMAPLNDSFVTEFSTLIKHFKERGTTILCITHYYQSVISFTDHISILRDGNLINTMQTEDFLQTDINKLLWGQFLKQRYPKIDIKKGKEVLCVENLSNNSTITDVSFSLCKGEILGIAGLVGAGKSMLAKTVFGLEPLESGTIYIDRLKTNIRSPEDAISIGLAYVTDERKEYGMFQNQDSLENAFSLGKNSFRGFLRRTKFEQQQFEKYSKRLNMDIDPSDLPSFLSGGEQQKLLLMRWLMSSARIFIFDEPTQSIDISSKIDTYNLFNDLILKGASIIICSSDLEELAGICDRILFMERGRITHELSYGDADILNKIYDNCSNTLIV